MARTLLFVAWALVLFLVQTSWPAGGWIRLLHLPVILVVYAGLSQPLATGLAVTILTGLLTDTFSGGAFGLFLLLYSILFIVAKAGNERLNLQPMGYRMLTVFFLDLGFRLLLWGLVGTFSGTGGKMPAAMFAQAAATGAVSPICFALFDRSLARAEAGLRRFHRPAQRRG